MLVLGGGGGCFVAPLPPHRASPAETPPLSPAPQKRPPLLYPPPKVHLVMELCAGSCLLERVMAEVGSLIAHWLTNRPRPPAPTSLPEPAPCNLPAQTSPARAAPVPPPEKTVPKGRCREHEAAALTRSLLEVLAHAHDLGVAHRDVKVGFFSAFFFAGCLRGVFLRGFFAGFGCRFSPRRPPGFTCVPCSACDWCALVFGGGWALRFPPRFSSGDGRRRDETMTRPQGRPSDGNGASPDKLKGK